MNLNKKKLEEVRDKYSKDGDVTTKILAMVAIMLLECLEPAADAPEKCGIEHVAICSTVTGACSVCGKKPSEQSDSKYHDGNWNLHKTYKQIDEINESQKKQDAQLSDQCEVDCPHTIPGKTHYAEDMCGCSAHNSSKVL